MEKPILQEVICYLPHDLKAFSTAKHLGVDTLISNVHLTNVMNYMDGTAEGKILLRPFDLVTPITVNGQKEIPYCAIAKLIVGEEFYLWRDINNNVIGVRDSNGHAFKCLSSSGIFQLLYDGQNYGFESYKIFNYFFENKIDFQNLIGQGKALDVTTLETNPYN